MFLALRACNLFKMFSIFTLFLATLLSSTASASGLPQLPARTIQARDAFDIAGWTPKPTSAPNVDLFRRQDSDLSPLCGFVEGNYSQILSCTAQTEFCNFDIPSSAFGCCTGSDLTGCGYFTSCLDSTASCDAACQRNTAIQRCSESAFPRCVKYTYDIAGAVFSNFGCQDVVSTPTPVVAVLATTVDGGVDETSAAAVETSISTSERSSTAVSSQVSATSSLDMSSSLFTTTVSSSSDSGPSLVSSASEPSRAAFTQTQASAGSSQADSTTSTASPSTTAAAEGSASKSMVAYAGAAGLSLYLGMVALSFVL